MGYTEYFNESLYKKILRRLRLVRMNVGYCPKGLNQKLKPLALKSRCFLMAEYFNNIYENLSSPLSIEEWKIFLGDELLTDKGIFNSGYWLMPISTWIEKFQTDQFDESMQLMYELTKRHTSEYCIRPFLEQDFNAVYKIMLKKWVNDDSFHVRRLCSEGLRPGLPWAKKMTLSKNQINKNLKLLKILSKDQHIYVRKSVANHLRDLIKLDKEKTLSLRNHLSIGCENQQWILKHSIRNNLLRS